MIAPFIGKIALTSSVPAIECMMALIGINKTKETMMPIAPAKKPMMIVSALKTAEILPLDAPIERKIPISLLRSRTLI